MSNARAGLVGPLLLFAALALLTFLGIGHAFGNGDEVIYAQNIREMRESGNWGVLQWQGVLTFQRPTAPFVLSMASESVFGGEFGLRAPMALFSLLTLGIVYWASWLCTRRRDAAAIAAVLCATVPSYHLFTRSLLSDAPFLSMTTLALLGTLWALNDKRGIVVAGAGLGGAIAIKSMAAGPTAIVLAPWLVYALYRHRAYRQGVLAAGVGLGIAAPYFTYSYLAYGDAFLEGHFGWTLGKRLAGTYGSTVGMDGGVMAYPAHLWNADGALVVVWLAVAALGGLYLWKRGDKAAGCAATTALGTLAIFSLFGTRLPHYILGLYPACAIALACVYTRLVKHRPTFSQPLPRVLVGTAVFGAAMLGVARPMSPGFLLTSPASVVVGARVAELSSTVPVYTLDWYAPALAYYAHKPWLAFFSSGELVTSLNSGIAFLGEAGNVKTAPPWPTGRYRLAGPTDRVLGAHLPIRKILFEAGDSFVLVEVDSAMTSD